MKEEKANIKMTVYEQEKQIVKTLPKFNSRELEEVYEDLADFIKTHSDIGYFMLNSKELSYYTIFKRENKLGTHNLMARKILNFITENQFLTSLGDLKVLKRKEENSIEIWIGETHFMFFCADPFFVTV